MQPDQAVLLLFKFLSRLIFDRQRQKLSLDRAVEDREVVVFFVGVCERRGAVPFDFVERDFMKVIGIGFDRD